MRLPEYTSNCNFDDFSRELCSLLRHDQGTFETIHHLMPLTICFTFSDTDGRRLKQSKWLRGRHGRSPGLRRGASRWPLSPCCRAPLGQTCLLPALLSALGQADTFTALAHTSPWISTMPRTAHDMDDDPGGPGSGFMTPSPKEQYLKFCLI